MSFVSRRYEREDKKRKKAIVLLLVLLMIGSLSGSLYGYWAESISAPDAIVKSNNQANIGKAKVIKGHLEVTTDFTVSDKLVPTGRTDHSDGTGNVESVMKDLTARWVDDTNAVSQADDIKGTLKITATPTFTDPSDTQYNATLQKLLKIKILSDGVDMISTGKDIVLNGSTISSKIHLTLDEPENKTEYEAVRGKAFKVTLNYTVDNVRS